KRNTAVSPQRCHIERELSLASGEFCNDELVFHVDCCGGHSRKQSRDLVSRSLALYLSVSGIAEDASVNGERAWRSSLVNERIARQPPDALGQQVGAAAVAQILDRFRMRKLQYANRRRQFRALAQSIAQTETRKSVARPQAIDASIDERDANFIATVRLYRPLCDQQEVGDTDDFIARRTGMRGCCDFSLPA